MLRWTVLSGAFLLLFLTIASAEGACEEDSFPCDDGQCVRREDWCDGKKNCDDGSDEEHCKEKFWGVSFNKCDAKIHFRCNDGRCWPLTARCDGRGDCKDSSDEKQCDEKIDEPSEIEEKYDEDKSNEISKEENGESKDIFDEKNGDSNEISEEKNGDSNEISEEKNGDSKEISEEKNGDSNEISEEKNRDSKESSEEKNGKSKESSGEENGESKKSSEVPSLGKFPLDVNHEVLFPKSTTEMDFYAKKMEHSEVKRQYSTRTDILSTTTYRPPLVRPLAQYTERSFKSQTPSNRKPAAPYSGPTRAYTPRPYRYIGEHHSAQKPLPYREQYPVYDPSNNYRPPYHSSDHNYISSHPRTNNHQQYRNNNNNNERSDWRNGVTRPPRVYGRQLKAPSRFYFNKNYNEQYGRANYASVKRGVEWILSIQNTTGGWGKETPRALVALSLFNNSFLTGSHEKDLMQKYFQIHLGVNLLRDKPVSLNRLAMFVNALIATCQDPRDFQGWDLTELIRNTMLKYYRASRSPVVNPLVYLSLCLADRNLTHYEVHHLMAYLMATKNDEATRDMTCLALEAFACHMQKERHNVGQYYTLQKMAWNATSKILQRMKDDGSFGSVYSTAIAAKALMSVNETMNWNPERTFRFLKNQQQGNGSFGDLLATYHALPALSGRSLLHLRNTECNPPRVDRELSPQEILHHPGPKFYIRYSLHMGSPLATSNTIQVHVPTGISFFDVMRVAEYENDYFKFSYEEVNGKINVYSISDIPNDPEGGLSWRLYIRNTSNSWNVPDIQQLYMGDIRELLPTPDQHIIFWYHSLGF